MTVDFGSATSYDSSRCVSICSRGLPLVRLRIHMPINKDTHKRIPITVTNEVAEQIAVLAAKERRSVASWIRNLIEDKVIEEQALSSREQMDADK